MGFDIALAAILARSRLDDRFDDAEPDVVAVVVAVPRVKSVAVSSISSTGRNGCDEDAECLSLYLSPTAGTAVLSSTVYADVALLVGDVSSRVEAFDVDRRVMRSGSGLLWRGGEGETS